MKIVASTKLTRAQKAMTDSRAYGQTSNQVYEEAETKPLEGEKKTLMIICSSDKGLCGGIHSGLTRYTRRQLEEHPNIDLVVIGEKCKAQLGRSNNKNMVLSFAGVGKDVPTFADAQAIADQIVLLPEDYASIKILYNKFLNAQSYEATPIEAFSEEAIANSPNFAAFEIDDEVLAHLREYTLANSLYWALAEGHACEQSARRNAMDVSIDHIPAPVGITNVLRFTERLIKRRRYDWEISDSLQQNTTSRHYGRVGRDHHWRCSFRGRLKGLFFATICTYTAKLPRFRSIDSTHSKPILFHALFVMLVSAALQYRFESDKGKCETSARQDQSIADDRLRGATTRLHTLWIT